MRLRTGLATLLLAAAILAGCSSPPAPPPADTDGDGLSDAEEMELGTDPGNPDTDADGTPDHAEVRSGRDPKTPEAVPHVIVAVIDTGINVYHERFQLPGGLPPGVLRQIADADSGAAPVVVDIAQEGTYEERVEADSDLWDGLEEGVLYHFAGTRVLGISFGSGDNPVLDDAGHGTMTAGAVLDANPEAIVVLVEGFGAESEAWASRQPWIDLVSMSYGPFGSIPLVPAMQGSKTHVHTQTMWALGQVPVGAADNSPALSPGDETSGPPWVVSVAGDDPESGCREHVTGTAPDFTADFTQTLPRHDHVSQRREGSGTSFATPTTAGTMSHVLLSVRKAWNHTEGIVDGALAVSPDGLRLTNAGLRDAFNRTATYFTTSACVGSGEPVNPAAPWMQQGWGHVGPEIANATAAHLLGTAQHPPKPAPAVAYQESLQRARQAYWGLVP